MHIFVITFLKRGGGFYLPPVSHILGVIRSEVAPQRCPLSFDASKNRGNFLSHQILANYLTDISYLRNKKKSHFTKKKAETLTSSDHRNHKICTFTSISQLKPCVGGCNSIARGAMGFCCRAFRAGRGHTTAAPL